MILAYFTRQGFVSIEALPETEWFDSAFFTEIILLSLIQSVSLLRPKIVDEVDLMRSIFQFSESRFALKYSYHPFAETILLKVWYKFLARNGWRSWGGWLHWTSLNSETGPCAKRIKFLRDEILALDDSNQRGFAHSMAVNNLSVNWSKSLLQITLRSVLVLRR
jgi:hypothetical protein